MKEHDEIEDLFRSAFTDFEVAPPPSVKEAIDREIGLAERKKRGGWWLTFSLLGFLCVATACFFAYRYTSSASQIKISAYRSSGTIDSSDFRSTSGNRISGQNEAGGPGLGDQTGPENALNGGKPDKSARAATTDKTADAGKQRHAQTPSKKPGQTTGTGSKHISSGTTKIGKGRSNNQKYTDGVFKNGDTRLGKGKSMSASGTKKASGLQDGKTKNVTSSPHADSLEGSLATAGQDPPNTVTPPAEMDSSAKVVDSTKSVNPAATDVAGKEKPKNESNTDWLLSLRGGPTLWPGQTKEGIQKTNGWALQAGISRNFWGNYGLSSGLELESWRESLSKIETITTKTFLFTVDVPIYDPQNPDSIIGYDLDSIYATHTKDTLFENKNQVFSLSVPLYFRFSQPVIGNFIVDINAGVVLGYQKSVSKTGSGSLSGSVPQETHAFGMKLVLQPQLRYQFGQLGVSVFTNLGYDLFPAVRYTGFRPLQLFGTVGVGLHWKL